ncbi:nuclear transport factor 2 family protein [Solwaraspora sp. WMMB335]|uniref:nuclear transport factor 2 family protein n=1 Tax=Solwaraspora sp. WMMB335 TaxID=3404118 RepID=UPI003B9289E8
MGELSPSGAEPSGRTNQRTHDAVLRYLAALNAHDADAVAASVSAGFVNEHTSALGRTVTGRSAYRRRLDGFLAEFADLHYEVEELLIDGDRAAVAYRMSFRSVSAGRVVVRLRGMFRFRVDAQGLVAHRVDYWDSAEVHRQLTAAT